MANKRTFKGCNKQQHKTKAHKKATNKIINKTYAEYKQRELNRKGEKMGRALGKHAISLYSTGHFHWLKWGM